MMKIALIVALLAPLVASADPNPPDRGHDEWVAGTKAYDEGDYDAAQDHYLKAFDLGGDPQMLFNAAQACRMKKDYEKAILLYKSFLRNVPDSPKRQSIEARIDEMQKLIDEQKANAGKPPEGVEHSTTQPTTLSVSPTSRPTTFIQGQPWYRDTLGWTLLGGGVVLLSGAGILQATALSSNESAKTDLNADHAADLHRRAASMQTAALIVGGAGVVAATVGVVKLFVHDSPRQREAMIVSPFGLGLALSGSFN